MACKVSVIIPMYNVEEYLEECLNSVFAQTIDSLEVICVDDGSTDGTRSIAESYCSQFENVKLLVQENAGAAVARNRALDTASGKYIAFMDPDDWYPHKDVLRDLFKIAEENNAVICGGSLCEYVHGKGIVTEFKGARSKCTFRKNGFVRFSDYQFDYNYQRFIFQRDFLDCNHLRFPEYRRFQDPPFFVDAMIAAGKFYAIANITYCYRVNAKSIVWTEEKLTHLALGLGDILKSTSYHRLKELHSTELARVNEIYYKRFEDALPDSEGSLLQALERLCDLADLSLIENRYDLEKCIRALRTQIRKKHILDLDFQDGCLRSNCEIDFPRWIDFALSNHFNPTVSIIIPAFNCEQYIGSCIRSAREQTYGSLEILVINDGSTDSTLERAINASRGDSRVQILTKENGGLSSSRNYGVEHASGDFILFLDGDDLLEKDAIERLVQVSIQGDLDCLMFEAEAFYDDRESLESNPSYATYYKRTGQYEAILDGRSTFVRLIENGDYKPSACLQLLRKSFLLENKISFIEGILHEDNAFTFEVLHNASRVFVWDAPLYKRRVRTNSIMTSGRGLRNAYGYYCAVRTALRFSNGECSDDYAEALKKQCAALVRSARSFSGVASNEERDSFCRTLPSDDRLLFDLLILGEWPDGPSRTTSRADDVGEYNALEKKVKQSERELAKIKKSRSYKLAAAISKLYKKTKRILLWKR